MDSEKGMADGNINTETKENNKEAKNDSHKSASEKIAENKQINNDVKIYNPKSGEEEKNKETKEDESKISDKPKAEEKNEENKEVEEVEIYKVPSCQNLSEEECIKYLSDRIEAVKELNTYDNVIVLKNMKAIGSLYTKYKGFLTKLGDTMVELGVPELVIKMLKYFNNIGIFKNDKIWFPAYYTLNNMWNFSDASTYLARSLAEKGMVQLLIANIKHQPYLDNLGSKNVTYVIKSSLSILQNMSKCPEIKDIFTENNALQALKLFTTSENDFFKATSMMALSAIASEEENKELQDTGAIEFMVTTVKNALKSEKRRHRGFTPTELVDALARLAANDANKDKIVAANALPLFVQMLQSDSVQEQRVAARCLWNLSFGEDAKKAILAEDSCIDCLKSLSESPDSSVRRAAKGALWIILNKAGESTESKAEQDTTELKDNIFISYNWGNQTIIVNIADRLKADNFKVWLDLDQMGGSTLEAMADGVEKASVVLICMSEKYKLSPNCRTEAEYTFQLKKPIIPLMMQRGYKPDGWLGMILGTKLFVNFNGKHPFDVAYQKLIKELNGRGRRDMVNNNMVVKVESQPLLSSSKSGSTVKTWDNKQVREWLVKTGINIENGSFPEMNGDLLVTFYKIKTEAPEFFYQALEKKMNLSIIDVLKFVNELDKLMLQS